MSLLEVELFLRNEGALSPVGLGDMGPVCSVLGRGDELEAGDLAELSTILELAVKAHSRVHVPSASMMDAFILKIMDGFSFYEATPAPQEPSLPCASEIYEYSDDSGIESDEIPPEVLYYELVLQINVVTGKMRFFARSDDRDQKEYPISWQTLGTQRMANLTSAVLADIISKWEEYNAERAIQHARYYLHQKWASLDFEAHKGLLYDYVPLNVVFEHMPQFLINHQETPPRFWCKDAVKVEAP